MDFNNDDSIYDGIYEVEDSCVEGDKLTNDVTFYTPEDYNILTPNALINIDVEHIFTQESVDLRADTLMSQNKGKINPNWILLDSQSTVDLFCNADLLSNLRVVKEKLSIHCNAGNITTNMVGNLQGYGTV